MLASIALRVLLVMGLTAGGVWLLNQSSEERHTYYVSPSGSDTASGLESTVSLKTLRKALSLAQPGDTIQLADGEYRESVKSVRNGNATAPIRITGSRRAVLRGGSGSRIFEINHDYLTLEGFTIDGKVGLGTRMADYRDKLLYVIGTATNKGVNGLKVRNMALQNAGGECVRLRYFATDNEIANSRIVNCGIYDFRFKDGGKNGEGIYIGTAPEQLKDGKNPTAEPDASNNNWVHHNVFNTRGNECVEVKESAQYNRIEDNRCTGQLDTEAAGIAARGERNTIQRNTIYGNVGAGVRVGGDRSNQGIYNLIKNNRIVRNKGGGLKLMRGPQGEICGNLFSANGFGILRGEYRFTGNPSAPCSD